MQQNQIIGEFDNWSMVVLYRTDSGDVVHTHQCVTTRGGKHPTKRQLEEDAMEGLKQASVGKVVTPRKLSLVHVDPRSIDSDSHYKVDTKKCVLVQTKILEQKPTRKRTRKNKE